MRGRRWVVAFALAALGAAALSFAAPSRAEEPRTEDLAELSLEQLSEIAVTSVSGESERLAWAAASIYVITPEEIRRSGAATLVEALRLAPNLQVARADANQYAIGARGFNSVLTNKMLVLIDGRTVYSPLFSGVFWEAQQVVLEDVDRIEVISGPGGVLWGTNAVNGIINVITRSARETQGALVNAGAGTTVATGSVRFGAGAGGATHARGYARVVDLQRSENAAGAELRDGARRWSGGFRADWGESTSTVTLSGGALRADIEQLPGERIVEDYYLLAAWNRRHDSGLGWRAQAWAGRSKRDQPGAIRDRLETGDLELHVTLPHVARHAVLLGAGFRYQADRLGNLGPALAFLPPDRDLRTAQAFVQDRFHLRSNLDLILGAKLERNEFTDWEWLPSARVAWQPATERFVWAAWSRAVRAPARIDRELYSPASPPFFALAGGPDFQSEVSHVAELGYRARPSALVSYSITGFFHDHRRLRSLEPRPAGPTFENLASGANAGVEGWATWRVAPWFGLHGGWVEQRVRVRLDDASGDPSGGTTLGNDPHRFGTVRASFEVMGRHELDVWVRHVGALRAPAVPDYTSLNARIGVRLPAGFELSVLGTDLFDASHAEWGVAPGRPEIETGFFAQLRWQGWRAP